jgi:hypothetical protein
MTNVPDYQFPQPELKSLSLPDPFRLYLQQRRRALITELREIELLLHIPTAQPKSKEERPR